MTFLQRVGGQGGPRKETQQGGGGTGDGRVGPLALGLDAQVGAHLLKGDLQLPAQDKPFQDLGRIRRRVSTEQSLGVEGALGVSDQDPRMRTGGLPERYHTAVWEVSSTVRVVPSYQATDTQAQVTSAWSRSVFNGGRRGPFSGGRPF